MASGAIAAAQQVAQGEVVAQRLGHLLAFHHEELGVQPEARERLAGERFRLRDFVFVVREDQVDAAGVDVQRLAQVLDGHDGALDVPARAARADAASPRTARLPWALSTGRNRGRRPFRTRPRPRARPPGCR